jgi:hypothetical protein
MQTMLTHDKFDSIIIQLTLSVVYGLIETV